MSAFPPQEMDELISVISKPGFGILCKIDAVLFFSFSSVKSRLRIVPKSISPCA